MADSASEPAPSRDSHFDDVARNHVHFDMHVLAARPVRRAARGRTPLLLPSTARRRSRRRGSSRTVHAAGNAIAFVTHVVHDQLSVALAVKFERVDFIAFELVQQCHVARTTLMRASRDAAGTRSGAVLGPVRRRWRSATTVSAEQCGPRFRLGGTMPARPIAAISSQSAGAHLPDRSSSG